MSARLPMTALTDALACRLPAGPVSTWPTDPLDDDSPWLVGIVTSGLGGTARKLRQGEDPRSWLPIAIVESEPIARAFAALLDALPRHLSRRPGVTEIIRVGQQ